MSSVERFLSERSTGEWIAFLAGCILGHML